VHSAPPKSPEISGFFKLFAAQRLASIKLAAKHSLLWFDGLVEENHENLL
jgi:hypothetical protein